MLVAYGSLDFARERLLTEYQPPKYKGRLDRTLSSLAPIHGASQAPGGGWIGAKPTKTNLFRTPTWEKHDRKFLLLFFDVRCDYDSVRSRKARPSWLREADTDLRLWNCWWSSPSLRCSSLCSFRLCRRLEKRLVECNVVTTFDSWGSHCTTLSRPMGSFHPVRSDGIQTIPTRRTTATMRGPKGTNSGRRFLCTRLSIPKGKSNGARYSGVASRMLAPTSRTM